jgi:leucyl-tRNA synthetase
VVEQLNIKSQKDLVALENAKDMVYKDDFYGGILIVGPHSGKTIQEAKEIIRNEIFNSGDAFTYFEPERKVLYRSGDECVVAFTDQ